MEKTFLMHTKIEVEHLTYCLLYYCVRICVISSTFIVRMCKTVAKVVDLVVIEK